MRKPDLEVNGRGGVLALPLHCSPIGRAGETRPRTEPPRAMPSKRSTLISNGKWSV